jgi:monothiol glutaredoxin
MTDSPTLREIPATELKAMLDRNEPLQLIDVRSPGEHAFAAIAGARLLDEATYKALLELDRDTKMVFQCHHGARSRQAAHHFVQQGFTEVYNVSDGIEGWSLNVDPSVPRY